MLRAHLGGTRKFSAVILALQASEEVETRRATSRSARKKILEALAVVWASQDRDTDALCYGTLGPAINGGRRAQQKMAVRVSPGGQVLPDTLINKVWVPVAQALPTCSNNNAAARRAI